MHEKRFAGDISRLRSPERVEHLEVERVADLCLAGKAAGSVLDVGTGSGLFAEAFARRGLVIAGLDANMEMVEAARKFAPKGVFRLGNAEALPYPESSFDLVFLGLVLHEADDPLLALQEALRVARNQVAILEWPYREGVIGPPVADRLKPEDLTGWFKKAGFKDWKLTELANTVFYRLEV